MRRIDSAASIDSVDTSAATTGPRAPTSSSHDDTNASVSKGGTTATNINNKKSSSSPYVKYLQSYEGMVQHQDEECAATLGHLERVFQRIQRLGKIGKKKKKKKKRTIGAMDDGDLPANPGILTFLQMRRCLLRMGISWNRSSFPANSNIALDYNDDDISVLSSNSNSSRNRSVRAGGGEGRSDIMSTDPQLVVLLAKLVEIEEQHRATKVTLVEGGCKNINASNCHLDQGLCLPEFIAAYKTLVGGMHAFKSIPNDDTSAAVLCHRLKERTLQMLRPFGPNASNIYNKDYEGLLITTNQSSPNKKKQRSFFTGDVEELITTKDNKLMNIMEEHELEMDALTSNIQNLREEDQRRKAALKTRRQRVKLSGLLLGGIMLALVIIVEIRRRQLINDWIEIEREAESIADRKLIAQLNAEKEGIEKKLGVLEGKRRYQANRSNDVVAKLQNIETQLSDADSKELAKKAEIEHCLASHLELKEGLKGENLKKVEVDEEFVWCQSRLHSQERELNGLEHTSVGTAPSLNTSERGLVASSAVKGDPALKGHKPVYLEMKYNKSIRNSMFLRQLYSAVAGVAAGVLLQGFVPAAIKLFFPPKVAALPVAAPKQGLEMALVDGIFGSSIAFLLFQAIATFLMPL